MFRYKANTVRIPDMRPIKENDIKNEAKSNDEVAKNIQKIYHNSKYKVKPSEMDLGDRVLVKQTKINKFTPIYNPNPLTITSKRGSMITARNSEKEITRNSSLYKKISDECGTNSKAIPTFPPFCFMSDEGKEEEVNPPRARRRQPRVVPPQPPLPAIALPPPGVEHPPQPPVLPAPVVPTAEVNAGRVASFAHLDDGRSPRRTRRQTERLNITSNQGKSYNRPTEQIEEEKEVDPDNRHTHTTESVTVEQA
jgi:hypothetical protein